MALAKSPRGEIRSGGIRSVFRTELVLRIRGFESRRLRTGAPKAGIQPTNLGSMRSAKADNRFAGPGAHNYGTVGCVPSAPARSNPLGDDFLRIPSPIPATPADASTAPR